MIFYNCCIPTLLSELEMQVLFVIRDCKMDEPTSQSDSTAKIVCGVESTSRIVAIDSLPMRGRFKVFVYINSLSPSHTILIHIGTPPPTRPWYKRKGIIAYKHASHSSSNFPNTK